MLVLTRKLMEKLYIGDEICVTVVRLEGGQVRLGIDAPRAVSVVRAELVDGRDRNAAPANRRPETEIILTAGPEPERAADEPALSRKMAPIRARGIGIPRPAPSR